MKAIHFLLVGTIASSMTWSFTGLADSLEEAIKRTLSDHPQAQAGMSRWHSQQETISAARSGYWPSLDVVAGVGKQKKHFAATNPYDGVNFTRKEASFSIRQNLFSGLNTMSTVRSAKKSTMAEQWRLQTTYEELGLQVVDVYLKVLERRDHVHLAEENLSFHDDIYQQIHQRTVQGVARNSDLAQIEGRRARANANLISARNNLIDAESEYLSLVGVAPEDLEKPDFDSLVIPVSLEQAIKKSRDGHPGIQAANLDIQSSQAQYKAVRSAHMPTLDFEVDQNWRDNADGAPGATKDLTAMVRVRYNLFRGGGDRARLQESAYKVEESRAQLDRTFRNTEEKLRIAWAAFELTGQQADFLALHQESSKETVVAYREQFNIGKRTLLDLLDGENELFQSSRSLKSTQYQEAFARYRILGATGQLLNSLNISQPVSDASH
ncbi:hypothetical protein ACH42_06885 [Endozoicomonas sp. (ex Bugula neritina AB1)]|nr:hypothetical protein ACH42_06885 [Endozoicomonas sp. (ex Bugula neritina AB1)]